MEELGLLTLSQSKWAKAKHRADVIGPLAKSSPVGRAAAEEAATELGISVRKVYGFIKRWRAGTSLMTDLAMGHSSGDKGKQRSCAASHKRESLPPRYLISSLCSCSTLLRGGRGNSQLRSVKPLQSPKAA